MGFLRVAGRILSLCLFLSIWRSRRSGVFLIFLTLPALMLLALCAIQVIRNGLTEGLQFRECKRLLLCWHDKDPYSLNNDAVLLLVDTCCSHLLSGQSCSPLLVKQMLWSKTMFNDQSGASHPAHFVLSSGFMAGMLEVLKVKQLISLAKAAAASHPPYLSTLKWLQGRTAFLHKPHLAFHTY